MMRLRVIQVARAGGPFELVEREIPQPAAGQVRIRVQACGICHSDAFTRFGAIPGIQYPRVPGHEVVGVIDAVGADAGAWQDGARVGVGWHGGHCGQCASCRRGDVITCAHARIPGIRARSPDANPIRELSGAVLSRNGLTRLTIDQLGELHQVDVAATNEAEPATVSSHAASMAPS